LPQASAHILVPQTHPRDKALGEDDSAAAAAAAAAVREPASASKVSPATRPVPARRPHTVDSAEVNDGVVKQTIALRVRPKSASAARGGEGKKTLQGSWNLRTNCVDLGIRLIEQDANTWRRRASAVELGGEGGGGGGKPSVSGVNGSSGGSKRRSKKSLSTRRPAIPGQVCYGLNTQNVPLPRRPQTTAGDGRANRPTWQSTVGQDSTTGCWDSAAFEQHQHRQEKQHSVHQQEHEQHQEQHTQSAQSGAEPAGRGTRARGDGAPKVRPRWLNSTLLADERTGHDRQFRYPQGFAAQDVALVSDYHQGAKQMPPPPKAAWVHRGALHTTGSALPPIQDF